jgi:HAD superfamily hydrolase (TIGR01509 family)
MPFAIEGCTLLFDMDGTLTDSDALHFRAFNMLLEDSGRAIDHAYFNAHIIGRTNDVIMAELFPGLDAGAYRALAERKETLFRSQLGALEPVPGALELLDYADRAGWPKAVVTNAPRRNAEAMLAGLGIAGRFDAVVIGEELAHAKPHPLPYLSALERLGCNPADALAFEDSHAGVRAAAAAGVATFGMLTSLPEAALREAGAFAMLRDFNDPVLWTELARRDARVRTGA